MFKHITLFYAVLLLAFNGSSALLGISNLFGKSSATVSDSTLEDHGIDSEKSTMSAIHGLVNGEIPDDDGIENIGASLKLKGIKMTDEHMKIAKNAAKFLNTGEGDGDSIANSAHNAIISLASQGGYMKEEHAELAQEGINALRRRDAVGVAKTLAKALIDKDIVTGALGMHDSWKKGKYVDMAGHSVTFMRGAMKSRVVPVQFRAAGLAALTGVKVAHKVWKSGLAEGAKEAASSLKDFESVIPMPSGGLGILRRGASIYMNRTNAIVAPEETTPFEADDAQEAALDEINQMPQPNEEQKKSKRHVKAKLNTNMVLKEESDEKPNESAETTQDIISNEEIVEAVQKTRKKQIKKAITHTDTTETNEIVSDEIPENLIPINTQKNKEIRKPKRKTKKRRTGQK